MRDIEIIRRAIQKTTTVRLPKDLLDSVHWSYIYSHSFAKAFWGEDLLVGTMFAWKYHLQEMVLYEHPEEYLRKFL